MQLWLYKSARQGPSTSALLEFYQLDFFFLLLSGMGNAAQKTILWSFVFLLPPLHGFWRSNSSLQVRPANPLPTDPSHGPKYYTFT